MKVKKCDIQTVLKKFPPIVEVDQIIEQILFLKNIEEGLSDLENNRLVSHKKTEQILAVKF